MKRLLVICFKVIVGLLIGIAVALLALGAVKGKEYVKALLQDVTDGKVDSWGKELVSLGDKLDDISQKGEALLESGKELAGQIIDGYSSFEGYDIQDANLFDGEHEVESGDIERSFEGIDVQALAIELGGCKLEVLESVDGTIQVVTKNIGKFQAFVEEGTLCIRATRKVKETAESNDIYLYLPAGCRFGVMELEVGAGQIQAKKLEADSLKLEVGAGQVVAESVSADVLEASVGAGDMTLKEINLGQLAVDVDAGRLQAEGLVLNKVIGECSVGNLELKLTGTIQDYDYLLDCAAGNIYLDGKKYASGMEKEIRIDNGAGRSIELDCAVGNIRVTFAK